MARKSIFVSDLSGESIAEGDGAEVTIKFHDARKGIYKLDVTDAEARQWSNKGIKIAKRGRKSNSEKAATA